MDTLVRNGSEQATRPLRHLLFPKPTYPSGHPADECPACHGKHMEWIANEALTYNYLCEDCGRCWTMGPDGAVRVNPITCRGCDRHEQCIDELRIEFAASPWPTSP